MIQLPVEILLSILKYSEVTMSCTVHEAQMPVQDEERKHILNLCLVSKLFHKVCLPALYQILDLRFRTASAIDQLLQTLMENPDLAKLVKEVVSELQLEREHPDDDDRDETSPPNMQWLDPSTIEMVVQRLDLDQGAVEELKKAECSWNSRNEAETALVVALCPNLEFLGLDSWNIEVASLLVKFLRQREKTGNLKLRELRLHRTPKVYGENAWEIYPLLALSTLQIFAAQGLRTDFWGLYHLVKNDDEDLDFLHVVSIRLLEHDTYPWEDVSYLLSLAPQLAELVISLEDDWEEESRRLPCLGNILREQGTNLRRLELYDKRSSYFCDNWSMSLGDISTLSSLQELWISNRALADVGNGATTEPSLDSHEEHISTLYLTKSLPVSLRELWIVEECEQPSVDIDQELKRLKADPRFTDLKSVQKINRSDLKS